MVADDLLLHRAYNPSASHPLSTSPYTGEARGGPSAHPASQQARPISPSVKPFGLATSLVRGRQDGERLTGRLLLHPTYNPSGSHSFATSPYTGEARRGKAVRAVPFTQELETLVKINKEKRLCFLLQCGKLFALKIQLYLFYGQKGMLV